MIGYIQQQETISASSYLFQIREELGSGRSNISAVVCDVGYIHLSGKDLPLLEFSHKCLNNRSRSRDGATSSRVVTSHVNLWGKELLDVIVAHT